MDTENVNKSPEWLKADAAVQIAYALWLSAVISGDANDVARAKAVLDAAYAARDGAK